MRRITATILLLTGISSCLCGGCVGGCARSHFGTGGMAFQPGDDPLDDPRYTRLLRVEKEGRALKIGGFVVVVAAGAYLLITRRPVKPRPDSRRHVWIKLTHYLSVGWRRHLVTLSIVCKLLGMNALRRQ